MEEWIPRIFVIEICLSAVSAFGRPDYNLPLFIFALMIWDYPQVNFFKAIGSPKKPESPICLCFHSL
jgi:hypothetical protein